jgi:hypothetical protein
MEVEELSPVTRNAMSRVVRRFSQMDADGLIPLDTRGRKEHVVTV